MVWFLTIVCAFAAPAGFWRIIGCSIIMWFYLGNKHATWILALGHQLWKGKIHLPSLQSSSLTYLVGFCLIVLTVDHFRFLPQRPSVVTFSSALLFRITLCALGISLCHKAVVFGRREHPSQSRQHRSGWGGTVGGKASWCTQAIPPCS